MSKVKFTTMDKKEIKFGKNNFIEVARKKAVSETGEENEFISISRGYYTRENEKRYKANIAIPTDEEFIEEMIAALKSL